MLRFIKKNKTFKKRKLVFYQDKKRVCDVTPWWGWYSINQSVDIKTHKEIRNLVLNNLYWLLGHDCDFDEWKNSVDAWNQGKHIYGVPVDKLSSMFFSEEEMNVALNSFYN